jgi:hypothetical protein
MDLITKLRPVIKNQPGFNAPWVYTKYIYEARCNVYHRVYHQHLGRIHSFCRDCWKVVARPRNVVQMFDMYEYQRMCGNPCKLGFEARPTVHGLWGGYFYNRSKEEALERYAEVREWADSVDKDIPVIVKRYCTEFEIGPNSLGPSNELPEQTEKEKREEAQFDNHFFKSAPQYDTVQPEHVQAHVMRNWIHWAYQYGDGTYKELTGGNPLFPPYVTYHQEVQ